MKESPKPRSETDRAPAIRDADAAVAPALVPRRWILLAIVLLAVVARVLYFVQLSGGPCIEQHRWAQTDMHYFHGWGRAIAEGDWLSTSVTVPMHAWHVDVATEYLAAHPERRAEFRQKIGTVTAGEEERRRLAEEVWLHWLGGRTFYQDPLYPYLIGLTFAVFGPDPRWVFVWQMCMGVATCVLIFLVTERWFGTSVGGVAGLLAAGCAPLVYHELILVRETAIVFVGFVLLHAILRALERATTGRWFVVGALLGTGILLKSTFVLFALCFSVGLAVAWWRRRRELVRCVAVAACGLLLVLTPLVARNLAVGVAPFGLASSGALTFVSHNAVDYDANVGGFHVGEHLGRILGDTDGRFLPAVAETLATHSVGSLVRQLAAKVASTFCWFEIPDNSNFYVYRNAAPVLRGLVTSWVIASFGLIGLVLTLLRRRALGTGGSLWPLHLLVATSLAALMAFMVTSRLRLPFIAALIPFAALCMGSLVGSLRLRGPRGPIMIVASLAALIVIGRPLGSDTSIFRVADLSVARRLLWEPRIDAALERRDLRSAEVSLAEAMRQARDDVEEYGPANIEHRGAIVDGAVAIGLFQGPYVAALTRAEVAGDWNQAAQTLASFLKTLPAAIDTITIRLPAAPSTRAALFGQARFYASIFGDCAEIHERAGLRDEAAPFADRARAIQQMLEKVR